MGDKTTPQKVNLLFIIGGYDVMKKIVSAIMVAVFCFAMFGGASAFAAEKKFVKYVTVNESVPDGYTAITNAQELLAVRDNLEGKYILMNDVNAESVSEWKPLGDKDAPFKGVFNGNGYTISNITITDYANSTAGLFGVIENAIVANVCVENINITINRPYQVTYNVGGVTGIARNSHILNCSAYGNIDITSGGTLYVGGISGYIAGDSMVANCMNNSSIKATGELSDEALSMGMVKAHIGGIAGIMQIGGTIKRSVNQGSIVITPRHNVFTGGICGSALYNAPISDCANIADITVMGTATAGGICGQSHSITNSYNTGLISLEKVIATKYGAIAGTTQFDFSDATISPLPENAVFATVSNCYYIDTYTAAIGNADGGDVSTVKALSADEIKNQSSFEGFDFTKVWTIPQNAPPTLKYKTSEISAEIDIIGTDSFELFKSIVYAASNNNEIVSIESDSLAMCNSNGTTSLDTINSDGDFVIMTVTVEINAEEAPQSIFDKVARFFASILAWLVSLFNN